MMPALFVAHGAPTYALVDNAATRFWATIPKLLPRPPKAILILSGHWESSTPKLSSSISIQHDFSGFSAGLYRVGWPLHDDPEMAAWMVDELAQLGIKVESENRPLDHGVWVPLKAAWPEPAFPILQLSLGSDESPAGHIELGRKLASLRKANVLVIGSGGISHNLGRIDWQAQENEANGWAAEFMQSFEEAVSRNDIEALSQPWELPHGREAVPTLDHYLPFLVILGIAGNNKLVPIHKGWGFGTLALHSYGLGLEAPA